MCFVVSHIFCFVSVPKEIEFSTCIKPELDELVKEASRVRGDDPLISQIEAAFQEKRFFNSAQCSFLMNDIIWPICKSLTSTIVCIFPFESSDEEGSDCFQNGTHTAVDYVRLLIARTCKGNGGRLIGNISLVFILKTVHVLSLSFLHLPTFNFIRWLPYLYL